MPSSAKTTLARSRVTLVDPTTPDGHGPMLRPRHVLVDGHHIGPVERGTIEFTPGHDDEPTRLALTLLPTAVEVRGWRPWDECLLDPEPLYPDRTRQRIAVAGVVALLLFVAGVALGRARS